MKTVDEIWEKWDKDANGCLDRAEMRAFVQASLAPMGRTISDEEFDTIFREFDIDGSNTIERDEMAVLVKRMARM